MSRPRTSTSRPHAEKARDLIICAARTSNKPHLSSVLYSAHVDLYMLQHNIIFVNTGSLLSRCHVATCMPFLDFE